MMIMKVMQLKIAFDLLGRKFNPSWKLRKIYSVLNSLAIKTIFTMIKFLWQVLTN